MALDISMLGATTAAHYRPTMEDNFFKYSALLDFLKTKGSQLIRSGEFILQPLMYGKNENFQSYEGMDTFKMVPAKKFTAAKYLWKKVGGTIPIAMSDFILNQGKEQRIDLMAAWIKQAELSLQEAAYTQLHADGTGNDSKDMDGLELIISITAGQTVGGINSNVETWWENYRVFTTANGYVQYTSGAIPLFNTGADKEEGVKAMDKTFRAISNGKNIFPDLILASPDAYSSYKNYLRIKEQIILGSQNKTVGTGFNGLVFNNQEVLEDTTCPGTYGGGAGKDARFYFINSKYLTFYRHAERNFVTDEWVKAANQDAKSCMLFLWGNLATSKRSGLAVMEVIGD